MKSIIQKIREQNITREKGEAAAIQLEINNPRTEKNRRNFLKKSMLGGISLAGMMTLPIEDTI